MRPAMRLTTGGRLAHLLKGQHCERTADEEWGALVGDVSLATDSMRAV
jgi:hypothetical protein